MDFLRGFLKVMGIVLLTMILLGFTTLYAQSQLTDSNIESKIDEELFFHLDVSANQIDISVNDGIATLTGLVDNILAKERARKVAMAVKGVKGLINQVEVKISAKKDANITSDINDALLQNTATEAFQVDISTTNGVVNLSGQVDSWQEKQLSEYVAKGVLGVRHVDNDIEVDYSKDRSDYEIKAEIKEALENDIRLFNQDVIVEIENGYVTLNGTVGTLTEKTLAESYGWTNGVKAVDVEGLKVYDWADLDNLRKNLYPDRSDTEIEKAIHSAFTHDPRLATVYPETAVKDGVVTLRGTVASPTARKAAAQDARNIVGVAYVKNNIRVNPETVPTNAILENRVTKALERSPIVGRYNLDVSTWHGIVYLDGVVDSQYEKYHAEDLISSLKGVVRVVNSLTATSGDNYEYIPDDNWNFYEYSAPYISTRDYYQGDMSDKQLEKNIVDQLWWSPFVNSTDVKVEVNQGNAILRGTVDSWKEKQVARENALQGGAERVLNLLEVNTDAPK